MDCGKSFGTARALRDAGLAVKDCHTVVVTHSHPDHFGGASRVLAESNGKLIAHNSFSLGMGGHAKPEVSVNDLHAHEEAEAGREPGPEEERARARRPFPPAAPN